LSAYADTSFLFSLYVPDSHSSKALSLVKTAPLPWLATSFNEFELENSIYQFQFRRELTSADAKASIASFRRDIAAGLFSVQPFTEETIRRASLLSSRSTPSFGCRALDVLHVASAIVLGAEILYTFDQKQAQLAAAEGLFVKGMG
jgi:predicted nucleic acid-binding protein